MVRGSLAFAARTHHVPSPPTPPVSVPQGQPAPPGLAAGGGAEDPGPYGAVAGFGELITAARVPADGASALFRDVEALGAIDAHELQPDDWRALPSWGGLRELERRRVLVYLQHAIQ